jgi:hypothetical protein
MTFLPVFEHESNLFDNVVISVLFCSVLFWSVLKLLLSVSFSVSETFPVSLFFLYLRTRIVDKSLLN